MKVIDIANLSPQVVHSWDVPTRCISEHQLVLNIPSTPGSSQQPRRTPSRWQPRQCLRPRHRLGDTKASATPLLLTLSPLPLASAHPPPGRTTVTTHLRRRPRPINTAVSKQPGLRLCGCGQRNFCIRARINI